MDAVVRKGRIPVARPPVRRTPIIGTEPAHGLRHPAVVAKGAACVGAARPGGGSQADGKPDQDRDETNHGISLRFRCAPWYRETLNARLAAAGQA